MVRLLKFLDKLLTKFVEVVLDEAEALVELDGPLELLKLFNVFDEFAKLIRLLGELGKNRLLLFEFVLALRLDVEGVLIWATC